MPQKKLIKFTPTAFTLIELMIVVTIIIFLASIMVPKLFKYSDKAKQAEVAMMLASLHTAQQIYKAEHGTYSHNLGTDVGWHPTRLNQSSNKNNPRFYYTYGFYFPGAQEGIHYFVGKLKTPPQYLAASYAEQNKFVAKAAGKINGSNVETWNIDETRNIVMD